MSKAARLIGTVVGDYEIQEVLGEGGMGVIYRAEHILIGKKVAMKMLHPEFAEKPEVAERFFNEARAVNQIGHQNIIDISDYGFTDDERPYFIMELLSGKTLAEVLGNLAAMEQARALHIVRQIASALSASHKSGIIHRDLKPENIFLIHMGKDPDFVKILDFGIAKLQEEQNTRVGVLLGTPQYMPPEQAQGKSIDHRADLYALGILLYEMLTGEAPFRANTLDLLLAQIVTEQIPSPCQKNPAIPKALEEVILKAVRKDPDKRFQSATELLDVLDEVEAKISYPKPVLTLPTVEVPLVAAPARDISTLSAMASEISPIPSRQKILLGGFVFLFSAAAGVLLFLLLNPFPEETPPPLAVASPEPETSPSPPAPPSQITIELNSIPEGATVTLGEEVLGITPYQWKLNPSETPRTVRLSLDGYLAQEKTFTPNISRGFEVNLAKKPKEDAVATNPKPTKRPPPEKPKEKPEEPKKPIDTLILKPPF